MEDHKQVVDLPWMLEQIAVEVVLKKEVLHTIVKSARNALLGSPSIQPGFASVVPRAGQPAHTGVTRAP